VPLFNMQLGEIVFGGVGAGLYGMLVFVVLAVFIAGLMVGRTPEYLGKKIQAYDVKMAMLTLLVLCLSILGFTAWAAVSDWGLAGLNNGPARLQRNALRLQLRHRQQRQRLRRAHRQHALVQHHPRPRHAHRPLPDDRADHGLAGSLVQKKISPPSAGTFPVSGGTFVVLLLGTVLLVGALNFLPVLALGPIVEHFLMLQGKLF
jgi:K+-transporting ATPase ATPase A chain